MTELVGILNATPDSFSDGGKWSTPAAAIDRVHQLFDEGAAYVDIGAESTRPGATPLTPDEEWARLSPILSELRQFGPNISLDTFHPETVRRALDIVDGFIVNDVTGFYNPAMQEVVRQSGLRCIVSHLPESAHGDPQAAHTQTLIDNEEQVVNELNARLDTLIGLGIPKGDIIVDPGIGFGKTPELNRQLLTFAQHFPDYKVMIGYSRKRFLGDSRMELEPNLAAGRKAIAAGAAYLRVHDVAGHRALIQL